MQQSLIHSHVMQLEISAIGSIQTFNVGSISGLDFFLKGT